MTPMMETMLEGGEKGIFRQGIGDVRAVAGGAEIRGEIHKKGVYR